MRWRKPHLRTPGYIFGLVGTVERECQVGACVKCSVSTTMTFGGYSLSCGVCDVICGCLMCLPWLVGGYCNVELQTAVG